MTATSVGTALTTERKERKPLTTLCIFGGARSGNDMRHLAAATVVGTAIASSGIRLVYRGGCHGLAGAVAHAAASHGGEGLSIVQSSQAASVSPKSGLCRTVLVADAAAQEQGLYALAEAFVALPGGIGTLAEIARILGPSLRADRTGCMSW